MVGSLVKCFSPWSMDSEDDLWVPSLVWCLAKLLFPTTLSFPALQIDMAGIHIEYIMIFFLEIKKVQTQDMNSGGRVGLARIHEKAPASITSAPISPFFTIPLLHSWIPHSHNLPRQGQAICLFSLQSG